jgi:hypothetical protein
LGIKPVDNRYEGHSILPSQTTTSSELQSLPLELPLVGIKIGYLVRKIVTLDPTLLEKATMEEICHHIIKPITAQYQCSYVDYLEKIDPFSVGKAQAYISYARSCNFRDVMKAIIAHFNGDKEAFVWIDIFSFNQHQNLRLSSEFLCNTLKSGIKGMGKTVMVLTSWNEPAPLSRAWCIWELFCAIEAGGSFEIAMTEESKKELFDHLDQDPLGTIDKLMATFDSINTTCYRREDEFQIQSAIVNNIGYSELNEEIMKRLKEWILTTYERKFIWRKDHFGKTEEKTLLTMKNLALLYDYEDKSEKAEPLFVESYEKRKEVLGGEHIDTLKSLQHLAEFYFIQKKLEKAGSLYLECFTKAKTTLGMNHALSLLSMNQLASVNKTQRSSFHIRLAAILVGVLFLSLLVAVLYFHVN